MMDIGLVKYLIPHEVFATNSTLPPQLAENEILYLGGSHIFRRIK